MSHCSFSPSIPQLHRDVLLLVAGLQAASLVSAANCLPARLPRGPGQVRLVKWRVKRWFPRRWNPPPLESWRPDGMRPNDVLTLLLLIWLKVLSRKRHTIVTYIGCNTECIRRCVSEAGCSQWQAAKCNATPGSSSRLVEWGICYAKDPKRAINYDRKLTKKSASEKRWIKRRFQIDLSVNFCIEDWRIDHERFTVDKLLGKQVQTCARSNDCQLLLLTKCKRSV